MSINHLLDKDSLQTYEDGRLNLNVGTINCQTGNNTTSATNKTYVDNAISTSIGNIVRIYDLNEIQTEAFNPPIDFFVGIWAPP